MLQIFFRAHVELILFRKKVQRFGKTVRHILSGAWIHQIVRDLDCGERATADDLPQRVADGGSVVRPPRWYRSYALDASGDGGGDAALRPPCHGSYQYY